MSLSFRPTQWLRLRTVRTTSFLRHIFSYVFVVNKLRFPADVRVEHIVDFQTIEIVNAYVNATFEPDSVFRDELVLEEGELYAFVIVDLAGDGLADGGGEVIFFADIVRIIFGSLSSCSLLLSIRHSVLFRMENSEGEITVFDEIGPDFSNGNVALFRATRENPDVYFLDKTFAGGLVLDLFLAFDDFPEEIGVKLTFANGTVLFERPPRHFWESVGIPVNISIAVPSDPHDYVLTVTDVYGDGFGTDSRAGYILYETESGGELVASWFESGFSERTEFRYPLTNSPAPTAVPTLPPTSAMAPAPSSTITPQVAPGAGNSTLAPTVPPTVTPAADDAPAQSALTTPPTLNSSDQPSNQSSNGPTEILLEKLSMSPDILSAVPSEAPSDIPTRSLSPSVTTGGETLPESTEATSPASTVPVCGRLTSYAIAFVIYKGLLS